MKRGTSAHWCRMGHNQAGQLEVKFYLDSITLELKVVRLARDPAEHTIVNPSRSHSCEPCSFLRSCVQDYCSSARVHRCHLRHRLVRGCDLSRKKDTRCHALVLRTVSCNHLCYQLGTDWETVYHKLLLRVSLNFHHFRHCSACNPYRLHPETLSISQVCFGCFAFTLV